MDKLNAPVQKARTLIFYLKVLNVMLLKTVPFNKPHRLKVLKIGDEEITIGAENKLYNQNHIKGVHACLLATLCPEYAAGLSLLLHLSPTEYRIILKNINMTYHYQAKKDVYVNFKLNKKEVETNFKLPLLTQEALFSSIYS